MIETYTIKNIINNLKIISFILKLKIIKKKIRLDNKIAKREIII
jgi:hypothetical protein